MVTADNLSNDDIREWERGELARLRSPTRKRQAVQDANDALSHGTTDQRYSLSQYRRDVRQRIADAINSRAKSVR